MSKVKTFDSIDNLRQTLLSGEQIECGDTWAEYKDEVVTTTFIPYDGLPIETEYTLDEFMEYVGERWKYWDVTYWEESQ
jgi:hypothetical protein